MKAKLRVGRVKPADVIIGQRILAHRLKRHFTQTDLGRAVGVAFQQIQKYERGKNRVSASTLLEISKALNIPVAQFFEGL